MILREKSRIQKIYVAYKCYIEKICGYIRVCVHAQLLQSYLTLSPCGLQPSRLLCPWDSPGKNPGVGGHALLQGIFLTQGSNLCLLCFLY